MYMYLQIIVTLRYISVGHWNNVYTCKQDIRKLTFNSPLPLRLFSLRTVRGRRRCRPLARGGGPGTRPQDGCRLRASGHQILSRRIPSSEEGTSKKCILMSSIHAITQKCTRTTYTQSYHPYMYSSLKAS